MMLESAMLSWRQAPPTHRCDGEGPDGVLCQVLHLLQGDLNVPVGRATIGRPVLVTLDLRAHKHTAEQYNPMKVYEFRTTSPYV